MLGVECWGDDVPDGKITSFALAVNKRDDEEVVFGWACWPTKEAWQAAMKLMHDAPELQMQGDMPFDGGRMFWGGFEALVQC